MKEIVNGLKEYVWLLPILVAVLSSMLAFAFGRESEKRKRYISLADEKLNLLLSGVYKEIITISEVHENDVSKIKLFIKEIASRNDLHKIFDDIIIDEILRLYIQIERNELNDERLIKRFNTLSRKLENLYWQTLNASASDYKWWRNTTTINAWKRLPMILVSSLKSFFEYIFVALTIVMAVFITIVVSDFSEKKHLMLTQHFLLYLMFTFMIGLFYYIFLMLSYPMDSKRNIKNKKIISKVEKKQNPTVVQD